MNGRSLSARWWFIQVLTVLGLGAAFAVYFLAYLPMRTAQLTERNFRLLGDMGEQITEAVAILHTTLTNAAYLALASTNASQASQSFSNSVRQLKLTAVESFTPNNFHANGFRVKLTAARQVNGCRMGLSYTNAGPGASSNGNVFSVSANLGDLLRPILMREEFSDLLLVNNGGDVLFQLDQAETRITNLVSGSDLRIERLRDLEKNETNHLRRASGLAHLPLLGKDYKLFSRPITFSLDPTDDGSPTEWFLVGLVPARAFDARVWELPSTIVILFIFAAIVGFLSWPFLNVAFSSPREELTRGRVACVLVAAFFGCAALTFLLLDNNVYPRLEDELDAGLDLLSANIQQNFSDELNRAKEQLRSLNKELSKLATDTNATNWAAVTNKNRILTDPVLTNASYPYLTLVNWLNPDGYQAVKWTTLAQTTRSAMAGDRNYFRSINEGWAWPSAPDRGTNNEPFFIESIFSRGRGGNVAVLSMPFPTNAWPTNSLFATNQVTVASLEFRPISLFQPVLPAGYGFCLIEASGKVVFHSDERRNLRENFIQEVNSNPRVLAAIHGRASDHFDLQYKSQTYHLRITPMAEVPWTLMVFRYEQTLRCVHQNLLCSAGLLFCWYLVLGAGVLLFVALLVYVWRTAMGLRSDGWLNRIWPKRAWRQSWASAIVVLFGAVTALLGVLWSQDGCAVLGWGIGIPLLALGWHRLPARWKTALQKVAAHKVNRGTEFIRRKMLAEPMRFNLRAFPAHIMTMGGTFILVAMLPALACYKVAFLMETGLFVKGTQLELLRNLEQRAIRVRLQEQEAGTSNRVESRLAYGGDLYYSNFFATVLTNSVASSRTNAEADWCTEIYSTCRVYFNEPRLRNGGLLASYAADASWIADFHNGSAFFGLKGSTNVHSALPVMEWPSLADEGWPIWLAWYAALFLVVSTPFLICTFVARRLLLFALPRALREKGNASLNIHDFSKAENRSVANGEWVAIESSHVCGLDFDTPEGRHWLQSGDWKRLETGTILAFANRDAITDAKVDKQADRCLADLECDHDKTVIKVSPKAVSRPEEIAGLLDKWHSDDTEYLSDGQKLVLYQVARTGFADGVRPELHSLFKAGLLRCDPELRLRNESLRRYVLAHFGEAAIKASAPADEADSSSARWRAIRSALGLALAVGALFLFITQREIWQLAIGLTSSFASGFGNISKVAGIFRKKGQPSGPAD